MRAAIVIRIHWCGRHRARFAGARGRRLVVAAENSNTTTAVTATRTRPPATFARVCERGGRRAPSKRTPPNASRRTVPPIRCAPVPPSSARGRLLGGDLRPSIGAVDATTDVVESRAGSRHTVELDGGIGGRRAVGSYGGDPSNGGLLSAVGPGLPADALAPGEAPGFAVRLALRIQRTADLEGEPRTTLPGAA